MSPEREEIISRLWGRMAEVTGVKTTARNPVNPPKAADIPRINIFEFDDVVVSRASRGASQPPAHKRAIRVLVESFYKGTTEEAATQELGLFMRQLKAKLYQGGVTLGLKDVEVAEESMGEVLRPPNLDLVVGVGMILSIRYTEDVAKIIT